MTTESRIEKVLVVLSPDLVQPNKPMESGLLRRAVGLARKSGCELELFHACHDSDLEDSLFVAAEDLESARIRLVDKDATRVAELAKRVADEGVKVTQDVRWDYPRIDAILRKVSQASPDLVMKAAREHSYILGMTTNTDWELARRSPSNVWLVNEDIDDTARIIAAVGGDSGRQSDILGAADLDLLRSAGLLRSVLDAQLYPVNAFRVPKPRVVAYGLGGSAVPADSQQEPIREAVAKKHADAVQAFARFFEIDPGNVFIREGHPADVIPEIANSIEADMIMMEARSIGRLERLFSQVTVEPVMSEAQCDVFIVRDPVHASLPDVSRQPFYGLPKYDLENAIVNPDEAFDSPQEVANAGEISIDMRFRILQGWEQDVRAEMTEENEGGPVTDIDTSVLDEILAARELLKMRKEKATGEELRSTS